jgi:hypothetical protein
MPLGQICPEFWAMILVTSSLRWLTGTTNPSKGGNIGKLLMDNSLFGIIALGIDTMGTRISRCVVAARNVVASSSIDFRATFASARHHFRGCQEPPFRQIKLFSRIQFILEAGNARIVYSTLEAFGVVVSPRLGV